MFKKVLCVLLLAVIVICGGCGCDSAAESEEVRTLTGLLKSSDLAVSDELITAFFNYDYRAGRDEEHPYFRNELRFIANTDADGQPNWDDLTLFVFEFCGGEGIAKAEDGYYISASQFDSVAKRFYPLCEYTPADSAYLIYGEDGYTPLGFDTHDAYFFRLTDISESGGTYTASFTGFVINESDFPLDRTDAWLGKNGVAVLDKAGVDYMNEFSDIKKTVLDIFLSDDYASTLEPELRLTFSFRLSGDSDYPFEYLSAYREFMR